MDVRENLVELLTNSPQLDVLDWTTGWEEATNYLIAHGVTVQEWIPVTERLPEAGGYVVCMAKRNPFSRFMPMVARVERNGWVNPITEQYISDVIHWMPMPSTEGLK